MARAVRALAAHDVDWPHWFEAETLLADGTTRRIADDGLPPHELAEAVTTDAGDGLMYTGVSWPLWRLDVATPQRSGHLGIETWPDRCFDRPDPEFLGHLCLIGDPGHFNSHVGHGSDADPEAGMEVEARREENVEALFSLLFLVMAELQPRKIAIHTDGMPHLGNAHGIFLPTRQAWLEELAFLRTVWEEGWSPWKLEPLGQIDPADSVWTLHPGRTPEQRSVIWRRLNDLIPLQPRVETRHVDEALATGQFDFSDREEDEQLLLLDFSHPLQGDAAWFFIRILESVAGGD